MSMPKPGPLRPLSRVLTSGLLVACLSSSGCSEALYPPRPAQLAGPPVADPPHSQAVVHVVITQEGLSDLLNSAVPSSGEGLFTLIGTRRYGWQRGPFSVRFDAASGRIAVTAPVQGEANLPGTTARFAMNLTVEAQPVLSADYKAQLQSAQVTVTTDDRLLKAAEWGGGVVSTIRGAVEKALRELRVDLRPTLSTAYGRLAKPLEFQVGDAKACADLGIRAIEAGPTVLAGGIEKDIAVVLAPSVTMPCAAPASATPAALPPLHNVASLPAGPFTVVVPVAATYQELQKAMTQAFTGGKLYFSKENPNLYLEKPEVYASGGQLVIKVHLDGFVKKGFQIKLAGDLYLTGRPEVRDNFLEVPDIQHTVETRDALLKLKTSLDGEAIRREVRQALRLDISARLQTVKQRLSNDLTFSQGSPGKGPSGCVRADVGRVSVTGLFAHDAYLRLYVQATAQASAYFPCLK